MTWTRHGLHWPASVTATTRKSSQGDSVQMVRFPGAVVWFALAVNLSAPTSAESAEAAEAEAPRLVEFSARAAVFESAEKRALVRLRERLPGSEARLVHVGPTSVQVEVPAAGARGPLLMELRRGEQLVVPPPPGPDLTPSVAVTVLRADAPSSPITPSSNSETD